MEEEEPRFIVGLRHARRVLLQLRERKVNEMPTPHLQQTPSRPSPSQFKPQKSQPMSPCVPQNHPPVSLKQKTSKLHQCLNQLGNQLYQCHAECESYQLIFNNLADHYSANLNIVEENERLKRKSYQLKEHIEEYKKKIGENQNNIQTIRNRDQDVKKMVREQLLKYLVGEAEKGIEEPLQRISSQRPIKGNIPLIAQNDEQKPPDVSINLRYQTLKKQVARKPVVRKPQEQDEQLRKPFKKELFTF